jgi:phosphoribosylanthranilate isomerase
VVKVKICGIRNWEEAKVAADSGADALGFIFAPSPRSVSPETAREIILKLPPFLTIVGVFVNEARDRLIEIARYCRLDAVQLHGEESPEDCRSIAFLGFKVIKSFVVTDEVPSEISFYDVDAVLLDAFLPGKRGGTGKTCNWRVASQVVASGARVILAGGLTPENVQEAILTVRPYAVDVASGVETRGSKDPCKVRRFIDAVRNIRVLAD